MSGIGTTATKFIVFVLAMTMLTVGLFFVFGQFRTGANNTYSAIFGDASDLRAGQSVRVAGVRVGTVGSVELGADNRVTVTFETDKDIRLTEGTHAAVRYLNLVGDRYLELTDAPGAPRLLAPGAVIPMDRTAPALDLDLLLGGLKPVIQGLNARDVNALAASLLQIFQGQGDSLSSLMSRTSSFSTTLADNQQAVQELIDNLQTAMAAIAKDGTHFSEVLEQMEHLVTGLSHDRDPIGDAVDALDKGTASMASLLTQARPPLTATVDQLNRLAPNLDQEKGRLDTALQKAPENYRKLVRIGSYGNFLQLFLCSVTLRLNDPTGKVIVLPTLKPDYGRCKDE